MPQQIFPKYLYSYVEILVKLVEIKRCKRRTMIYLNVETHIYFSYLIRSVIDPHNIFGLAVVNMRGQDQIWQCILQCLVQGVCNPWPMVDPFFDVHMKVADMMIGMLLFFLSHALFRTCTPSTFQYTIWKAGLSYCIFSV